LNFSFSEKSTIAELAKNKLKFNFKYDIKRLLAKDSLEMNDADRKIIKKACETTKENKILNRR